MQKIIVLGATSGIAQATQRCLAEKNKELLLVARSSERLEAVAADLRVRGAGKVVIYAADLDDLSVHQRIVAFAEEALPGFDTVLLAYGSMRDQHDCEKCVDLAVREWHTNFVSPAALLTLFANALESRGTGCIAAITSVAGDRGRRSKYVYGAAKGALSLFLQGLRNRLHPKVSVITIKPGPVATPMTAHMDTGKFAAPERVGRDICRTLERRSPDVLYTPWFWRYIMNIIRMVPEPLFKRLPL